MPHAATPGSGQTTAVELQWRVDERGKYPKDTELHEWAKVALPVEIAEKQSVVTICIVDSAEMRAANNHWRGQDKTTNVLSFPADFPPETGLSYLGDILVCAEVMEKECAVQGKSQSAHWAHIIIHGLLHLQGYDHIDPTDAANMEQLETEILAKLGYTDPYISGHGVSSITEVD